MFKLYFLLITILFLQTQGISLDIPKNLKYSDILDEAKQLESSIIKYRRDLHLIPELEFDLFNTSSYVKKELNQLGIKYKEYASTGIVGKIGSGKPVVALRADMDALPIEEQSGVEFTSTHPGKMHACGHDGHTAMLLGAAHILKKREITLKGTVALLFQPAEEVGSGADKMMKEKALDGVDKIFGFHVMPHLISGTIGINPQSIMGSVDEFKIVVKGKGGHAAMPHLTRDPIVTGADIISALQKIVSREISPIDSPVVTVTKFSGGTAYNVIPDDVEIWGTIRTLSLDNVKHIKQRVKEIAESVAKAHRCTADVEINPRTEGWGLPPLVNHKDGHQHVVEVAKEVVGVKNLIPNIKPILAGEDFAFYLDKIPGAFIFLGIQNETVGSVHGLHSPKFRIDESALHVGSAMHSALAISYLDKHSKQQEGMDEL